MKIREKILNLVTGYLAGIKTGSDYETKNFPTPKLCSTDVENPKDEKFCLVSDAGTTFDEAPVSRNLIVDVRVGCSVGKENKSTLYAMTEDVYKCIYDNRYSLAGVVGAGAMITPLGDVPDMERTDREKMVNLIKFSVTLGKNAQWYYDTRDFN